MSATCQATPQSGRGAGTIGRQSCVPVREPAPDLEDTLDLLARVKTDDQSAWEAILNRYLRPLKRIAHRHRLSCYARSVSDTDDLVQDALLKTIGRLRHFECRHRGALLAYLRQVVVNGVVDEARRCARRGRLALFDDGPPGRCRSPLESVLDNEEMTIGFREFGFQDGAITLNGAAVPLVSAAPHLARLFVVASSADAATS